MIWVRSPDGYRVPAVIYPSGGVVLTPAVLRIQVAGVMASAVRQCLPAGADYCRNTELSYQHLLAICPGSGDFCLSVAGRQYFSVFQTRAAFAVLDDIETRLRKLKP